MEILSFSGKDLVTRSAAQIKYLREHPEAKKVTPNMLVGEKHQHDIVKDGEFEEMKSTLQFNNIMISCCHDIVNVKERTITEVKYIDPNRPIEEWYFHNSILQCVLYDTVVHYTGGIMVTPAFRIKQGYKDMLITMNRKSYRLLFGNKLYEIKIKPEHYIDILRYFEIKAEHTRNSYDVAKLYDMLHSRRHFEELEQYFEYKQLK